MYTCHKPSFSTEIQVDLVRLQSDLDVLLLHVLDELGTSLDSDKRTAILQDFEQSPLKR